MTSLAEAGRRVRQRVWRGDVVKEYSMAYRWFGICVVALTCLGGLAMAQTEAGSDDGNRVEAGGREDIARQIVEQVDRLHELDLASQRHRAESTEAIRRLRGQIERLEGDIAMLSRETEQLEAEAADLRDRIQAAESERVATEKTVRSASAHTQRLLVHLLTRASTGVPSIKGMSGRIQQLTASLGEREQSATAAGGVLVEIHRFLGEYLQKHRERGLSSELVELPDSDRAVHGYVVRLGSVGEWFVSEDGREVLMAARDSSKPWVRVVEPGRREAVVELVEIMREQAEPRIIAVPIRRVDDEDATAGEAAQ